MIKFLKDFLLYGLASMLSKIIAIFLIPLYTGILSKEEYGVMALILACKGIIDLISNLNIHSGVARDYYEDGINKQKLISTGFWSILLWSFMILSIIYVSRDFWVNNILEISAYKSVFLIMIMTIPSGSLLSYFMISSSQSL